MWKFCFLALLTVCFAVSYNFTDVDYTINAFIAAHTTPGAVVVITGPGKDGKSINYMKGYGSFTYGVPPPRNHGKNPHIDAETALWDMASVTKVVATTTAIAQFYERGELDIDTKLSDHQLFGSAFSKGGKENITVRHCLLHTAGYPPDPIPNFWSKEFGCPEVLKDDPELSFSCGDKIFDGFLSVEVVHPPGEQYRYSDISMMSLAYVVGKLAQEKGYVGEHELYPGCNSHSTESGWLCYYGAYVEKYVLDRSRMYNSGFRPQPDLYDRCPPAWNDTSFRHRVIQGRVSDGNAFVAGGWHGHAGLFATAPDLTQFVNLLLSGEALINSTTVEYFTRPRHSPPSSSRALGWDTADNPDHGVSACGSLSTNTFTHTGYTGTQICCDPERRICTILLTNRSYPDDAKGDIFLLRQNFNTLVQILYDRAH